MDEYISKQKAKDLMGCCLASAKANLKVETSIFKKTEFESIIKTIESMIDVVGAVEAADVQPINPLVKVEERVPDASGNYLCYLADGEFDVLYFDRGIEDDMYNNDYPFGFWNTYPSEDGGECREWIEVLEVTHWMPLPELPKDGDTNG